MDNLVKLVAILGFVLACISLLWQVYSHIAKRREHIKGRIFITVVTSPQKENVLALGLDIWNNGQVPVYIKSIFLNSGEESHRLGATVCGLQFQAHPSRTGPLQPGEGRSYILPAPPAAHPPAHHLFTECVHHPEDKLWVSVTSHKAEVLRIPGEKVKPLLQEILEHDPKPPVSQPPTSS